MAHTQCRTVVRVGSPTAPLRSAPPLASCACPVANIASRRKTHVGSSLVHSCMNVLTSRMVRIVIGSLRCVHVHKRKPTRKHFCRDIQGLTCRLSQLTSNIPSSNAPCLYPYKCCVHTLNSKGLQYTTTHAPIRFVFCVDDSVDTPLLQDIYTPYC